MSAHSFLNLLNKLRKRDKMGNMQSLINSTIIHKNYFHVALKLL